jgi:myo-inositol-1(or 4)-monophosphatase
MLTRAIREVARAAAREAGRDVVERLRRPRQIRSKGLRDVVTDADLASQAILTHHIRAQFPTHAIVAEESDATEPNGEITWVLDPIDGTSNYARGFPCFSISIGVVDERGLLAGVVFDPLRDHLFEAARGEGAWHGESPLRVSAVRDPMEALVGLDFARDQAVRRDVLERMTRLGPRVHSFRSVGSAALGLCYVAAGWTDAYLHAALAPWDTVAGVLIVREAGGRVTNLAGGEWTPAEVSCLASNGAVHDLLVAAAN